ncbi:hypothetical protein A2924_00385 [Candidatus Giovannonibacteria bacterium RIFCSPLOWO2_01_FULL_44_16]|uniref:FCP1 homology domain-containing protein n=1 Tax=Candidatus Giovannonibacteria bacterium RIFCSPLOWO2_01_FULL_44_16 TaxID=1798348 RepID=A0A1F5X3I3_9BACT|nr:MAG: hypothetical protein A2924_00385 [Candidatus Giovannonibacteria bacterium RIFCSPLOWO2_01_FULL_44_16]
MKSHVDNKILGFDMDGVIVDNNPLKLKVLEKMGWKLRLRDMPVEILTRILRPDDMDLFRNSFYHNKLVATGSLLMPGTVELLEKIRSSKIKYFLISRRAIPEIAIELLKMRGIWPKYFNELNAFFVVEPVEKNIKAKELGITHYVDDETRILSVLDDVPNKFLFDHMNVFPEGNYTKVASHEELEKYFLG